MTYVTNELKKKYQTNLLEYKVKKGDMCVQEIKLKKDVNNAKYTLEQILDLKQPKLTVELMDVDEIWMKSADSPASFKFVYNISKT